VDVVPCPTAIPPARHDHAVREWAGQALSLTAANQIIRVPWKLRCPCRYREQVSCRPLSLTVFPCTHGRAPEFTVDRAEIALAIDHWQAHRRGLGHAHEARHRIRAVAMRLEVSPSRRPTNMWPISCTACPACCRRLHANRGYGGARLEAVAHVRAARVTITLIVTSPRITSFSLGIRLEFGSIRPGGRVALIAIDPGGFSGLVPAGPRRVVTHKGAVLRLRYRTAGAHAPEIAYIY